MPATTTERRTRRRGRLAAAALLVAPLLAGAGADRRSVERVPEFEIRAYDTRTGEHIWTRTFRSRDCAEFLHPSGDTVVVEPPGAVLSASSGRRRWTTPSRSAVVAPGSPALATDGVSLVALASRTGRRRWSMPLQGRTVLPAGPHLVILASPLTSTSTSSDLVAVDRSTGVVRWRLVVPAAEAPHGASADARTVVLAVGQGPAEQPDQLIRVLDAATGEERLRLTGWSPVLRDGAVIRNSSAGVVASDATDGAELWRTDGLVSPDTDRAKPDASVLVYPSLLARSPLRVLDARSGRVVRRFDYPSPTLGLIGVSGRIGVFFADGARIVGRDATGRTRWKVHEPPGPGQTEIGPNVLYTTAGCPPDE